MEIVQDLHRRQACNVHGCQVGMTAFGTDDHAVPVATGRHPCTQGALANAARQIGPPVGVDLGGVEKVTTALNKGIEQGKDMIPALTRPPRGAWMVSFSRLPCMKWSSPMVQNTGLSGRKWLASPLFTGAMSGYVFKNPGGTTF